MKRRSVMLIVNLLQVVMGAAVFFISREIVSNNIPQPSDFAAEDIPEGAMLIGFIPPSSDMEFIMLACGLVLLICSLWQLKKSIKYAGAQVISASVICIISAFFGIRSEVIMATTGPLVDMDISNLYYLTYPALACGVASAVIPFIQFLAGRRRCLPSEENPAG